jgi:hypothetical protein
MALVPILAVHVDQPSQPDSTSKRYRVRLVCGCTWWEYHATDLDAPVPGQSAYCVAPHTASNPILRKEAPRPARPMYRARLLRRA